MNQAAFNLEPPVAASTTPANPAPETPSAPAAVSEPSDSLDKTAARATRAIANDMATEHSTEYATQNATDDTDEDADEDVNVTAKKVFKRGRPRSQKSRSAILRATNALLNHMSVQELSIEGIAKKAKVGKTTIYRWWPNKTAIVMDAIASQPGTQDDMPTATSNAEAVRMQLDKLIRLLRSKNGETIGQLFSEAQGDRAAQEIFADSFLSPLIDAIGYSFEQGQETGEFRKDIDTRIAVDMLCGPIFFRLMAHPGDFNEGFQQNYPARAVSLITA